MQKGGYQDTKGGTKILNRGYPYTERGVPRCRKGGTKILRGVPRY